MRLPRFRLAGLMLLVLLSALALAAYDQLSRLDALAWRIIGDGSVLCVPFLLMVLLKFGLVFSMRSRRRRAESTEDEPLP